jgi:hypothetical protein
MNWMMADETEIEIIDRMTSWPSLPNQKKSTQPSRITSDTACVHCTSCSNHCGNPDHSDDVIDNTYDHSDDVTDNIDVTDNMNGEKIYFKIRKYILKR